MKAQTELKVLQWNIWQEGTMVPGGYEAIVSEIARLEPDFVTFSEVRNYHQTRFCDRIVTSLREKGKTYYSFYSYDSGLLSKHPITDSTTVFPEKNDHGSIYRMVASVNGQQIFIKANRIRSIETKGVTLIDEGIRAEFIAIVNYGIVGLIQLELGYAESADISNEEAKIGRAHV